MDLSLFLFLPFRSLSEDKSEKDVEREAQLLECRLTLTEERNAVLLPPAGSGIPGAPAHWWDLENTPHPPTPPIPGFSIPSFRKASCQMTFIRFSFSLQGSSTRNGDPRPCHLPKPYWWVNYTRSSFYTLNRFIPAYEVQCQELLLFPQFWRKPHCFIFLLLLFFFSRIPKSLKTVHNP